ncbi:hypothetical protein [[Clostridium] polysaccharolyticum]|jgi:hypothetical protein|uniref:Uncharacterized protein n=1 Tax=[Clostridium] polysaccharolyticum TaxID=29364 RepID=A0A1H9YRX1_9FIRM|nr:hypothetical protein [[Clostridium] polysaccharolyticum]SES71384.1 hypothetical protein SAMN04487772_102149 [[Clostridium] polysaccharolyticum]
MKNSIDLLYQGISMSIYCVAFLVLVFLSKQIYEMEHHVDNAMYRQHVISCEVIRN